MPAAQAGGLLVRAIAMLLDHGQHPGHGRRADAPTFGLTVDHVAGGGHRDLGQAGDVAEFHGRSTMQGKDFERASAASLHRLDDGRASRITHYRIRCQRLMKRFSSAIHQLVLKVFGWRK
ncbi:hypothetical protein N619_27150 [Ectopseudomonas oleovorans]|nr:hypothetical protein N619_27150 [Pseudomonas oleovorans]